MAWVPSLVWELRPTSQVAWPKRGKKKEYSNSSVSSEAGLVPTKSQLNASREAAFTSSCAPVTVLLVPNVRDTPRSVSKKRAFHFYSWLLSTTAGATFFSGNLPWCNGNLTGHLQVTYRSDNQIKTLQSHRVLKQQKRELKSRGNEMGQDSTQMLGHWGWPECPHCLSSGLGNVQMSPSLRGIHLPHWWGPELRIDGRCLGPAHTRFSRSYRAEDVWPRLWLVSHPLSIMAFTYLHVLGRGVEVLEWMLPIKKDVASNTKHRR